MASNKIRAGIRFNDPVAKYMKLELDIATRKLTVYLTGEMEGTEMTVKGSITQSGWSPVQEG